MKKIFTLLAAGFFAASTVAQVCTPGQLTEDRFIPSPDTTACIERNVAYNQVFRVRIPTSASGQTISYMKVDSVTNLPAGLTAEMNKPWGTQYVAGETGCVLLSGTTNAPAGQYRLGLYVKLKVQALPELPGDLYVIASANGAEDAHKYIIYLGLTESTGTCPCNDTTGQLPVGSFKAYDGTEEQCAYRATPGTTGISDINSVVSGLNIVPNPFSSNATVEFNAEVAGTYTARITNIIGKEVMRKSADVTIGANSINISRNDLAAGVYFFSLSDGKSLVTKRFVIE